MKKILTMMVCFFMLFLVSCNNSKDKNDIMERFNNGDIDVLVSTTVVEVGVDVPNATVIVIENAERFGLAQLHQLRGRVQRGEYEGICYLLTDSKDALVHERLKVLTNSNDGFEISMQDLKLRGPGDILGTRQSGVPAFILGNIIEDTRFIEAARNDAKKIANMANEEDKAYYQKIKDLSLNFVD